VFRGVRDESQEAPEVPHGSGDKTGRRKIFVGSFGKKIPSELLRPADSAGSSRRGQSQDVSQQYFHRRYILLSTSCRKF
jgi:hypothetical protein